MRFDDIERKGLTRAIAAEGPEAARAAGIPSRVPGPSIRRRAPGPPRYGSLRPPFRDERWLVTGAANGLGRAWAERLLASGARVVGLDLPEPLWASEREGLPFACAAIDLGDTGSFDAALMELRRISGDEPFDVVAHVAGIQHTAPWRTFADRPERRRRILDVNAYGPIAWTARLESEARLPLDAPVLALASLSCFTSFPFAAPYAASKDVLAMWVHTRDRESGAQSLVAYPGPIRTAHAAAAAPRNEPRDVARRVPPQRLARRLAEAWTRGERDWIPGVGVRLLAECGRWAPGLTARAMRSRLVR